MSILQPWFMPPFVQRFLNKKAMRMPACIVFELAA